MYNQNMKKILITGGSGFVGSHVIKNIFSQKQIKCSIDVVDNLTTFSKISDHEKTKNKKFREKIREGVNQYYNVDTSDYRSLMDIISSKKYDLLIHLAAMPLATVAIEFPSLAFDAIVKGTQNLLECIRVSGSKTRIVYVSSSMVYGDFIRDGLAYETDPCSPKEIYGSLKYAGEILVSAYSKRYSLDTVICRPSAVYGPGDDNQRVIHSLLASALNRKPMKVYNGAETFLDFTYVDDLAKSLIAIGMSKKKFAGDVFNVTRGKARSLLEVAKIIKNLVPGSIIQEIENKEEFRPKRGTLSCEKIKKEIGYHSKIDLEESLPSYKKYLNYE
jgi:nucleoside-diphosphate-sugar epimerase